MRNKGKTCYIRVDKDHIVLVEVRILEEQRGNADWFSDTHLQEVVLLLKGVLLSVSQLGPAGNKATGNQQLESQIVTGDRVRLGYSVKKRPTNQTCLVPVSSSDDADHELESLKVCKEKLVVYVCPLQSSSPQKMSQLLKTQTASQTPSISSYFKRLSSSNARNQSTKRAESQPDEKSLPQPSSSEGHRNALKSIVNRVDDESKKKRRGRKITTKRHDTEAKRKPNELTQISAVETSADKPKTLNIDQTCSDQVADNNNFGKVSELENEINIFSADCLDTCDINMQDICLSEKRKLTRESDCKVSGIPKETIMQSSDLDAQQEISMEQKQDIKRGPRSVDASQIVSISCDGIEMQDTDLDMSILPSASFVVKQEVKPACEQGNVEPRLCLANLNRFEYQKQGNILVHEPDIFEKIESDSNGGMWGRSQSADVKPAKNKGRTVRVAAHDHTESKSKRKLPNFSSSDSDGSLSNMPVRPKKHVTIETAKQKTNPPQKRQKYNIPKDFFTGSNHVQSTLSAFMKKADQEENSQDKGSNSVVSDEELESLDCLLMEELSGFSHVQKEADATMWKDIRNLRAVHELNDEQLQFLVMNSERYLRDIFEGKVKCERHVRYKKGGKIRRDLTYQMSLGLFTDEQVDVVIESLKNIFCKRHFKYLDYLLKVMLPEMLIKFHMDIHGTNREQSERALIA